MLQQLKKKIRRHAVNVKGWKTNRKIVVIESDDWGAIRMPSRAILNELRKMGVKTDECHYVQNDSIASEDDLSHLYTILRKFRGQCKQAPIITANVIMCNPDFEKIRTSNFKQYHGELFTKTLLRYHGHKRAFNMWKEGIGEGLFYPQFHGREHLNVGRWIRQLQAGADETRRAFDLNVFGLSTNISTEDRRSYLAAYEIETEEDLVFTLNSISEGLSQFKDVFGYASLSSIAPNYTWNHQMEESYAKGGVRYLQGGFVQRSPVIGKESNDLIRHHMGENNNLGQAYLVRNCTFEPSSDLSKDWVDSCLKEISTAFTWKKPAIIESHRVNYIGYINPENRDRNLKLLEELLRKIVKTWPYVEFMTSDKLGELIEETS